jgi:hypothetical protein
MELGQLRLGKLELPGAAGQLQRERATASLVRELGDNYSKYHAFLAARLAKLGRPDPADYETYEAYAAAWGEVEDVIHAELTLRRCRGMRKRRGRLDAAPTSPLIDEKDRLLPEDV